MNWFRDALYRWVLSPAFHNFHNTGIAHLLVNAIYSIYVYLYPTGTIQWLNMGQPMKILYEQGGILSFSPSFYQSMQLQQEVIMRSVLKYVRAYKKHLILSSGALIG